MGEPAENISRQSYLGEFSSPCGNALTQDGWNLARLGESITDPDGKTRKIRLRETVMIHRSGSEIYFLMRQSFSPCYALVRSCGEGEVITHEVFTGAAVTRAFWDIFKKAIRNEQARVTDLW